MKNPALRASDTDRQQVIGALERHTAAGLLSLDEFGERVSRVLHAVTHGDLHAVTAGLPPDPGAAAKAAEEAQSVARAHARQLVIAFALAVLTLVLLGVAFAVGRG